MSGLASLKVVKRAVLLAVVSPSNLADRIPTVTDPVTDLAVTKARFPEVSGLSMRQAWQAAAEQTDKDESVHNGWSRFMRRVCAAATNVLGASIGGVVQFLLATRFDN